MIRSTRGLKLTLGVSLLTLGLFGPNSAHATMHWNVGGSTLSTSKAIQSSLTETGILHTKIGGNAVLFECKKGELVGVSLEAAGFVKGGDFKFSECITKVNGTTNSACEPNNNGTEPGVILTNPFHGLLALHTLANGSRDHILLLTSLVEETVGGVKQPVFGRVKMSAECPIGSNVPVIGPCFNVIDNTNGVTDGSEVLLDLLYHLFVPGPLNTELWVLSKTAEHVATILGTARINLTSDELWSGNAE